MKYKLQLLLVALLCSTLGSLTADAQRNNTKEVAPVFVDEKGVMRWKKNNAEANFFGVNYTVPFAYGYRSHQALGQDLEKAIDRDVYHMARLGFNAFRVHVWDTEISDSTGNLLNNEHLRLFDYLVHKLKERNIKILVTPIAFWGNGYPEPDEKTISFSTKYNKQRAVTEEEAFKAQERYLDQFFKHVNPYTGLTYQNDPDIIAAEINNEPKHTGPKARATEYVNRMVAAVRGAGWTKPIFYNISESPTYADAVAIADIDGVSFQWYPTGLVANHTLQGNYLPHVDRYQIPFDTIPAYSGKARMVYEFDAGDILNSTMYPAMARSFREAGFQWATQFAYDPLATAYGNTEYQTRYLNLAYTPKKAIAAMIAGKAFLKLPRGKNYGTYPQDSVFDVFRVSYKENLSEMNTLEEFYYSNNTTTKPANAKKLQHVAGVGTSPVVQYRGLGAYFIDKLENSVWRLEVMPDAIHIRDPFAKASPQKEVTRLEYREHAIRVMLPDLGDNYTVKGLNTGNEVSDVATKGAVMVKPGTYLLVKKGKKASRWTPERMAGELKLAEFVAPEPVKSEPFVAHEPQKEIAAGKPHTIRATIVGVSPDAKVTLAINNLSGVYKTIQMPQEYPYTYETPLPDDLTSPGMLSYRIIVQQPDGKTYTFPGGHEGNPWAWDNYKTDAWTSFVAAQGSKLELFNATHDRSIKVYPNLWRSDERQLLTDVEPGQLILRLSVKTMPDEGVMGFQEYIGEKLRSRKPELTNYKKLVIRARTNNPEPIKVRLGLISDDATAHTATVTISRQFQDIEIPLSSLQPAGFILLPRPYPGFHPFWFRPEKTEPFSLSEIEKLEVIVGKDLPAAERDKPYSIDVERIWLGQ